MERRYSMEDLLRVMQRLRDPEGGCPWDLAQDFSSIVPSTLEECYELAQAIEHGDYPHVAEELGDVLFQVVFYAQLGAEQDLFSFDEIVNTLTHKLLRRHPHVFADETVTSAAEQTLAWERHKQQERGQQDSILDGVPSALPALTRACKLQQRASRVGFDWPSIHGVSEKVEEELGELNEEIHRQADHDALADEAGDLLFAAVNLVRHAGVDPELALRAGNRKFTRRFRQVEQFLREAGQSISSTDLDTLDYYWEKAKQAETSS